jgi:hypothetical protein
LQAAQKLPFSTKPVAQTHDEPLTMKFPVALQAVHVEFDEQLAQPTMEALHSVHFPLKR